MPRIKARTPTGGEYSFYSLEEFVSAIERGRIKADWEVFHGVAGRWLPVTAHPAYAQALARVSEGEPARRNPDLVLMPPEQRRHRQTRDVSASAPPSGDPSPTLAPTEIERMLGRRYSQPNSTAGDRAWSAAIQRPSSPRAPLVTIPQQERSRMAVALERLLIVGIILALIGLAINSAQNRRRAADNDTPAVQPGRESPRPR